MENGYRLILRFEVYGEDIREYLDCPAVGGESKQGWEGEWDGEEAIDEEEVLSAEGLRPLPGIIAHKLLDGELEGDLLGLVEEEEGLGVLPILEGDADEAVDVMEEGVAEEGEGGEASEGEGVHALVEGSLHQHQ